MYAKYSLLVVEHRQLLICYFNQYIENLHFLQKKVCTSEMNIIIYYMIMACKIYNNS